MSVKLEETLQRVVIADCPAIKPSENKALLDQIENSVQDRFNNILINFKNMIDEELTQTP